MPGLVLVKHSFIVYQRKCRANREERLNIKFITGCFTAHWFLPHNTSLPMAGELELDVPEGPFQPNPFCDNFWVKLFHFRYWQFLMVPLVLVLAGEHLTTSSEEQMRCDAVGEPKIADSRKYPLCDSEFWLLGAKSALFSTQTLQGTPTGHLCDPEVFSKFIS